MRTIKLNRIKTTKGVFEDFWDSEGSFLLFILGMKTLETKCQWMQKLKTMMALFGIVIYGRQSIFQK